MDDRNRIITRAFETDPYAAAQGIRLDRITEDGVVVSLVVTDDHVNFHGVTHGGALFSLADCAFALASNAHGDAAVAIDTHLSITAASHVGDVLTATAHEMTRGRTLGTYRIDITRTDGRTVGLFTGTVFIRPGDG
ncbi:MAG: hotdog fold thioesterase [Actinomycetota bacterium]